MGSLRFTIAKPSRFDPLTFAARIVPAFVNEKHWRPLRASCLERVRWPKTQPNSLTSDYNV